MTLEEHLRCPRCGYDLHPFPRKLSLDLQADLRYLFSTFFVMPDPAANSYVRSRLNEVLYVGARDRGIGRQTHRDNHGVTKSWAGAHPREL